MTVPPIAAWLLAVSLLLPAAGRASEPSPAAVDAATRQLERGMEGDEAAIEPAAAAFNALAAAHPGDPLLLVYAGAATAMRADTTLLPWKKMRFAEDGLAQIDKALALLTPAHDAPRTDGTPVALETRFVAASTFLSLPGLFNRRSRGERLLGDVLASPRLAAAPLSLRGAVWLRAGIQAADDKRADAARDWFNRVVASNAPQAPAARARLKALGS